MAVILFGCYNGTNKSSSAETNQVLAEKTVENPAIYLGNYHGIQATYFIKNQYGYDMIIGCKKVSVPSSDFKFLIKYVYSLLILPILHTYGYLQLYDLNKFI